MGSYFCANPKVYVATFGCRTNQADSAAIREDFLEGCYQLTERPEEADVIVINSCTVTHRSDQQVRQLTRRLRRLNERARILLTGCYAQRDSSSLARLPGVDAVVGNSRKRELVKIAEASAADFEGPPNFRDLAAIYRDDFRSVPALELTPATQVGGRTRPFVKVQDGCDAKCSYCIIPSVRGPSRSVPPDQILKQVRDLVEHGFREIVLTGIHIGTYGMHLQPRYPLDRLIADIIRIPGLARLRLSSIEPMELSRRVIDLAAAGPRIAPHFHICLQSGSDRILRRMLRPYSTARFAAIVEEIRRRIPEAGIGTDLIAGFPGETEKDHRDTVQFVEEMPFTYLHVFPYSDRPGTAASRLRDPVTPPLVEERARELRHISTRKNSAFRQSFIGRSISGLTLSAEESGWRTGITGNYLQIKVDSSISANTIITGRVLREEAGFLVLEAPAESKERLVSD